jgi:hypothetical protein
MLARRTSPTHRWLTVGLVAIANASACADPEPQACDAFVRDTQYDVRFDEVGGDCLGPLQSVLPTSFITGEATLTVSLTMTTSYEYDKKGCVVTIEILKQDAEHAAQFYIFGDDLIDDASEVHGQVVIELSRIEAPEGTTLNGGNIRSAPTTPVCSTTARATLTPSGPAFSRP